VPESQAVRYLVSAGVVDDELVAATVELVGGAGVVLVGSPDVVLELVETTDDELEVITVVVGARVVLLVVVGAGVVELDVVGDAVVVVGARVVLLVVVGAGVVELDVVGDAVVELLVVGHGFAGLVVKTGSSSVWTPHEQGEHICVS